MFWPEPWLWHPAWREVPEFLGRKAQCGGLHHQVAGRCAANSSVCRLLKL